MAGVINPGRREGGGLLSTVMKGLSIARDVYGIKTDMAQLEKMTESEKRAAEATAATEAEKKRVARGEKTQGQYNELLLSGKYDEVPADAPGGIKIPVVGEDGTVFDKFVAQKKPEVKIEPPKTQNFADGTTRQWDAEKKAWTVVAKAPPKGVGGPGNDGAKKVSGEVAQNIGKFDAAMDHIGRLEGEWTDKTGAFSGLMQYVPGTDATQYRDAMKVAAQDIGQILEGGKLTDSDRDFYMEMMPTAGDSEGRAAEKFARLREYVASRKTSSVEGARQGGYDVSKFTPLKPPPGKLNQSGSGKAVAAPAVIPAADMTDAEIDAEIQRLKGGKK